jgi:hypothetical protein
VVLALTKAVLVGEKGAEALLLGKQADLLLRPKRNEADDTMALRKQTDEAPPRRPRPAHDMPEAGRIRCVFA